jgi:hypothetical protein
MFPQMYVRFKKKRSSGGGMIGGSAFILSGLASPDAAWLEYGCLVPPFLTPLSFAEAEAEGISLNQLYLTKLAVQSRAAVFV